MERTLIVNAMIFDGSGAAPFSGDVLVEGQRIASVRMGGGLPRGGARVIDGAGATLMPGLVEPHGHVSYADAASNAEFTRLPPEEHVLATMRNARTMLECGYTSVLSGAAAKPRLDVVIRNEINAGRIPGPALPRQWPGDHGHGRARRRERAAPAPSRDADVHLGRRWARRDPEGLPPPRARGRRSPEAQRLGPDGQGDQRANRAVTTDAEVAAAWRSLAPPACACAPTPGAPTPSRCASVHGLGIIYHANFADEEALDLLEANRDWCFVVPALGLTYQACYAASEWGLTPEQARERGLLHELEVSVETMGRMRKRGIRVLPGGDYGFAWNPHGTYARDLLLFVDVLGFTPMETLVAATRLGGEIMGRPDELGQVKPGYLADLLLVDGDPSPTSSACRARTRCW
jgi:imidazolonepropionase-like amidohydrolase